MATIRERREELGFTQAHMCEELGISRPTYIKFEKDPGCMTVGLAQRVCDILGCELDDIFFEERVKANLT